MYVLVQWGEGGRENEDTVLRTDVHNPHKYFLIG